MSLKYLRKDNVLQTIVIFHRAVEEKIPRVKCVIIQSKNGTESAVNIKHTRTVQKLVEQ